MTELVPVNSPIDLDPEPDAEKPSTLARWLYLRYGSNGSETYDKLAETEQAYWDHEAAAVTRAVNRGGFKQRATPPPPRQMLKSHSYICQKQFCDKWAVVQRTGGFRVCQEHDV